MKKLLLVFIITAFALTSCETLVNDVDPSRLPQTSNKLVVHGYLSPQDTLLQIAVGISSPVTGMNVGRNFSGTISLPGADVTLSNQGRSVKLTFNTKSNHYTAKPSDMPIVAGQTYRLKVTLNGLSVESSCTIPQAVAINEVRQDSLPPQFGSPNAPKDRTFRLFWQDPVGEANYYHATGYIYQMQRVQTGMNQTQLQPNVFNLRFNDNGRGGDDFLSDERRDGTRMASGLARFNSFWFQSSNSTVVSRRIELSLISCEKTYYDYHRLVNSFDGDNPFSEPTLIPSNIVGGLGCFAGYNRSRVVL